MLAALAVTWLLTTGQASGAFSGANGPIAFQSGRDGSEIWIMAPDGSGQRKLTTSPGRDLAPAVSPDGRRIVFWSDRDGNEEIYVMNADGSGQTRLTTAATWEAQPSWSPDGASIVFISNRNGNFDIFRMSAAGGPADQLTADAGDESSPALSPDGRKLAYTRAAPGPGSGGYPSESGADLLVKDLTTGATTNLTAGLFLSPAAASWSPDGTKIAFHTRRETDSIVHVLPAGGGAGGDVAGTEGGWEPAWAPDGSEIAFSPGHYFVASIPAGGGSPVQLGAGNDDHPDWGVLAHAGACSDGFDNDGDGAADYPSDGECASPEDDSEGKPPPDAPSCADDTCRAEVSEAPPDPPPAASDVIVDRPLAVTVMGDSIAWGQGLRTRNKFSTLVTNGLAARSGRRAVLNPVVAHSGAALRGRCSPAFAGEVPIPEPGIVGCQARVAQRFGPTDLVLLSGCINDVNVIALVVGLTDVKKEVERKCAPTLKLALIQAHALPGQPKVVLAGYYRIVSEHTASLALGPALPSLIANVVLRYLHERLFPRLRWLRGPIVAVILVRLLKALRDRAAARSKQFVAAFNSAATKAIRAVDPGGEWATLVDPAFGPRNALFARHSLLWAGRNDEVARARSKECVRVARHLTALEDVACHIASLGHPNVQGASIYASRILKSRKVREWFGLP